MTRSITLHGGSPDIMRRQYPNAPQPWVDLSTGINPWPYPHKEFESSALQHLPTASAMRACTQSMATAIGANADHLLLAPGSELLIRLLPQVLPARKVCVAAQSYADHVEVWRKADVDLLEHADPLECIDDHDTLVICNPNNPDGRTWSTQEMASAVANLAAKGGHLIIDEAYADLHPQLSLAAQAGHPGLIILRSIGKFYGLGGIRLGAMLAPSDVHTAMSELLGVWPISGPTLAIASRAYADREWQVMMRSRLAESRAELDSVLSESGIEIIGGTDLYRLIDVPNAERAWHDLASHGIYVRHFGWHPRFIRMGLPANPTEQRRLETALATLNPLGEVASRRQ